MRLLSGWISNCAISVAHGCSWAPAQYVPRPLPSISSQLKWRGPENEANHSVSTDKQRICTLMEHQCPYLNLRCRMPSPFHLPPLPEEGGACTAKSSNKELSLAYGLPEVQLRVEQKGIVLPACSTLASCCYVLLQPLKIVQVWLALYPGLLPRSQGTRL